MAAPGRPASNAWMAFLVGAMVVVVAVMAFAVYTSTHERRSEVALNLRAPIRQLAGPMPAPNPSPTPLPLPRPEG